MAKDFRRLWKDVTSTIDEAKAVRTLAEILVDKEGRVFISRLERKDAELCIEILDHVCRNSYLLPLRDLTQFSLGHRRRRPQARREACFLRHVEKTCYFVRTTARFHDNTGKDRHFRRHNRLRWIRRYQARNVHGTTRRGEDHEGCNAR